MAQYGRPRVRWLTNVVLNIKEADGNIKEKLFKSGSYTAVSKIVQYPDGYGDMYLGDSYVGGTQSVIEGVRLGEGYEIHGQLDIEQSGDSKAAPSDTPAPPLEAEETAEKDSDTKKKEPKRKWTQW